MSVVSMLNEVTEEFFRLHWPTTEEAGPRPEWVKWECFLRSSVPNYDRGGCYALFENESLVYVGKGAGANHGISRRLASHVLSSGKKSADTMYVMKNKWCAVTEVHTIGFPGELDYLAHALEVYLIQKMSPSLNSISVRPVGTH